MSKAILEFNLEEPEDKQEFLRAVKSTQSYLALWDIAQEVFRPARKHGYSDPEIQELIHECPTVVLDKESGIPEYNVGEELISKLEGMFYEILEQYGINLDRELS